MEYRTLVSEENESPEGLDPTFTSFLHTETQEDQDNDVERKQILFFSGFGFEIFSFFFFVF